MFTGNSFMVVVTLNDYTIVIFYRLQEVSFVAHIIHTLHYFDATDPVYLDLVELFYLLTGGNYV